MKKVTTVRVNLGNGEFMKCAGTLSKDGKTLNMSKGLKITIKNGDVVTTEEKEIVKRVTPTPCPFDMHQWFSKNK